MLKRSLQFFEFIKQPTFDGLAALFSVNPHPDADRQALFGELIAMIIFYLMKNNPFADLHVSEKTRFHKAMMLHHFLWVELVVIDYNNVRTQGIS